MCWSPTAYCRAPPLPPRMRKQTLCEKSGLMYMARVGVLSSFWYVCYEWWSGSSGFGNISRWHRSHRLLAVNSVSLSGFSSRLLKAAAELVLGFTAGGLKKPFDPKGREKRCVAPKTAGLKKNMFLVPRPANVSTASTRKHGGLTRQITHFSGLILTHEALRV